MKKLLTIIFLAFCITQFANAQSPLHLLIDDAKTYTNTNIVNNLTRAITPQKLNISINKIIDALNYLDTANRFTAIKFGVSGQDDASTGNRSFNTSGYNFGITGLPRKSNSTDSVLVRSTDGTFGTFPIGANKALSNLASVAVNTSLLPGTDNSIDLGSASKQWKNLYFPNTTSSLTGILFKNGDWWAHNYKANGTDGNNAFFGINSGNFTFSGASSGGQASYNAGFGETTLLNLTTGNRNTALGAFSQQNTTSGVNNTSVGQNALVTNTVGYNNTVGGVRAAAFGSDIHDIAAWGVDAASRARHASFITAMGTDAGYNIWDGQHTVCIGDSSLWLDSTAFNIVAVGGLAGYGDGGNYASLHDTGMVFIGYKASRDNSVPSSTPLHNSSAFGYNSKVFASDQLSFGDENIKTNLFRGSVGIGTTTPAVALDVVGTVRLNSSTALLPLKLDASKNITSAAIALGSEVSGDLAFANLTQIPARSVLGVTGNSTADVAGIQGTADQILRINGAGTALAFGSIDLSKSAAVGSSILGLANGGTGTTDGSGLLYIKNDGVTILGGDIRLNSGNVGIGGHPTELLDVFGNVATHHIKGTTDVPSIAAGAGAGTSSVVSITGTDLAGEITVTVDDPLGDDVFCTVTFANAYGRAPYVVITPSSRDCAEDMSNVKGLYVTTTATDFSLHTNTVDKPSAGRVISFHYHVIQ